MMNLNNFFKDFIFAKRCAMCGDFHGDNNLCFSCFSNLQYLTLACKKCQQPFSYFSSDIDICQQCIDRPLDFFDEMICPLIYNTFLKKHILFLKNHSFFYLADVFAKFLYNKMKDKILSGAIIVPVPLHSNRLFKRGYNQSWLLAKAFARLAQIDCFYDLLMRIRDTQSQSNKSIVQRAENVKQAFLFNTDYSSYIQGKQIFIIDDIITTGATIFESAKIVPKELLCPVTLLAVGRRIKS